MKTRFPTRFPVVNPERKYSKVYEDGRSLEKANGEFPDRTITPATFYNNSDFILSPRRGVKIADEEFLKVLIELQNSEITLEDYEFLLQLDCPVKPKTLATFRLQYEDDYEYEFSVLSTRFRFGGRKFSKCACSELKTRTRSRPRTPI